MMIGSWNWFEFVLAITCNRNQWPAQRGNDRGNWECEAPHLEETVTNDISPNTHEGWNQRESLSGVEARSLFCPSIGYCCIGAIAQH